MNGFKDLMDQSLDVTMKTREREGEGRDIRVESVMC